jgi:hypothetical protein
MHSFDEGNKPPAMCITVISKLFHNFITMFIELYLSSAGIEPALEA